MKINNCWNRLKEMNNTVHLFLILVLALLSFSHLNAQVSEEWVQQYNGSGNGPDRANGMVADGSGNVYVTGSIATGGGYAYATIKYSTAGAQQWVAIYYGPQDTSSAMAIAVDNAGNVYVTGGSTGIGTESDYATIKYNSSGGQEWVARYDGPVNGRDYGTSIAVDGLGNVYVTGNSQSGASANHNDYVTIKYNSFGDSLWVVRYHGPSGGNNYPSAVAVDGDGNVYVTGNSDGTASTLRDYATIKYNSSGVQLWATRYNYPVIGNDYATALAVDGSGNVYVTGASQGNGTSFDYATIKYNKYGYALWYKRYNGPGNSVDYAYALKLDGAGNVYVTGLSHGVGTNNSDYATIKYDPSGNQLWVARYDGPVNGGDAATALAVDSLGNVYVTGWSAGDAIGYTDYATVKYNPSGEQWWVQRYSGPGNFNDNACSIALDDSGYVYVTGTIGIDTTNTDFATIKYTKGGSVYQPRPLAKWLADTTNTIKWSDEGWTSVNIKCILNYGTPQETIDSIAYGVPNSLNEFDWYIPDTILSFRSKIIVENANDTTFYLKSGIFRLKPYLLTKLNSDLTYTAYKKDVDQWSFENIPGDVWPETWWQLFNYQGIDPLTGEQYSQTVADSAFAKARPDRFPDWESWVRAFTFNACYYNPVINTARYKEIAVRKWYAASKPWGGSCFGIAASNALAFSYKQEFGNKFPNFPPFANPISVGSDTNVIKTVSELFAHQFGNPTMIRHATYVPTPTQTLNDIKNMLIEDNTPIKTLSFWNNGPSGGGHNVLPYALYRDISHQGAYWIQVYDNAFPNSFQPIFIETVPNGGRGDWYTNDWPGWGGNQWILLEENASVYLGNPTVNKTTRLPNSLIGPGLEVYNSVGASMNITNLTNETTGFVNDTIYEGIPGSRALVVLNGSKTLPYGYYFPLVDWYHIAMSNFQSDTAYAYFFSNNYSFFYERSGAQQTETDKLEYYYGGGLTVSNPDSQSKSAKLSSINSYPEGEQAFNVRAFDIAQYDQFTVGFLVIESHGSAKSYNVELKKVSNLEFGRFLCQNIPLPANTTHTYVVDDWTNLSNTNKITVLVDIGNDGTIDDTLHLQNLLTDASDHGSLIPTEYKLYQCYPNPFNPSTTIKYDVPKSSHVTLKVYNLLGQEVATLVDDNRNAGTYEVQFDGSKLASGVYFYRLQAGDFIQTKKLVLVK